MEKGAAAPAEKVGRGGSSGEGRGSSGREGRLRLCPELPTTPAQANPSSATKWAPAAAAPLGVWAESDEPWEAVAVARRRRATDAAVELRPPWMLLSSSPHGQSPTCVYFNSMLLHPNKNWLCC